MLPRSLKTSLGVSKDFFRLTPFCFTYRRRYYLFECWHIYTNPYTYHHRFGLVVRNYVELMYFLLIHSMRNADTQWHHITHTPIGVYDLFVYDFYLLMNKYDKIWNKKASSLDKAFLKRKVGSSSVGVERFELPISCSQSRRVNRTTLYPEICLGEWWDLNPWPPRP